MRKMRYTLQIPVFLVLPLVAASCWMMAGLEKSDLPDADARDVTEEDDGARYDADAGDGTDPEADPDGTELPGDGPEEIVDEETAADPDADDPEPEVDDGLDAPDDPPDELDAIEETGDGTDPEAGDEIEDMDAEDPAIEDIIDVPDAELDGPVHLTCSHAATLEELIQCIVAHMPAEGSEGFVAPDSLAQTDWAGVAGRMLQGHCDEIVLSVGLGGLYRVFTFNDTDAGSDYCVLMETLDEDEDGSVDRGWGTFIVNPEPSREVNIHITHAISCTNTHMEGISVFKGVGGRSFMMAGAHRRANSRISTCQAAYFEADAAHNTDNMDQPAVREIMVFYDDLGEEFVSIQFHGMGTTSCMGVDVYLTYGRSVAPDPGDDLLSLRDSLRENNPDWTVNVPGDTPPCTLNGTTNVQGRLLNDVPGNIVCTAPAVRHLGRFIHIEQKIEMRSPDDWIEAIIATWP